LIKAMLAAKWAVGVDNDQAIHLPDYLARSDVRPEDDVRSST
jgi:hypothetical protein